MNTIVKEILNELYKIDNSLIQNEDKLIKIISNMIELKPQISAWDDFKWKLRNEIYDEITKMKISNLKSKPNIWKILTYIFWWVWIACFSFIVINKDILLNSTTENIPLNNKMSTINTISTDNKAKSQETEIISTKTEEIKPKTNSQIKEKTIENQDTKQNSKDITNENLDNNENTNLENSKTQTSELSSLNKVSSISDSLLMASPRLWWKNNENFNFDYFWSFSLEKYSTWYLKDNISLKNNFNTFIKNLDLWIKIQDYNINNFSVSQDKLYWYNINFDLKNWLVTFDKNYDYWPNIDYQNTKLNKLSQRELINLTKDFLINYKVDLSWYWNPIIDENYLNDTIDSYSQVNVTYQKTIDGTSVYDENWSPKWISFNIDLYEWKIVYVSWIDLNNYNKKTFENNTEINDLLNQNSSNSWTLINLQNPKNIYIDKNNELKPGLLFEVINSNDYYNKKSYIIETSKNPN